MNLETLANMGEFVGALGVIVSVVYLALQVRKQTEESRLAATRELAEQYQACLVTVVEDAEFAEIWLKGVKDYKGLPDIERMRLSFQFQRLFRNLEQQHLHRRRVSIDAYYFSSMDNSFTEGLTFPGLRQWWELSQDMFDKDFRNHVGKMIEAANERGYQGSLGTAKENVPKQRG